MKTCVQGKYNCNYLYGFKGGVPNPPPPLQEDRVKSHCVEICWEQKMNENFVDKIFL